MKTLSLIAVVLTFALTGCGSDKPPLQSTDPEALEREATKGRELRGQLEK